MTSILTGKIRVLPDTVSSQIAAGEVVERPASVVKELLENSLDAGSSLITVDVEDGGRQLIQVRDNGEGMNRQDAQVACHRFATSKLQLEKDLHTLTTLGFRGEALPSIASISHFHLKTQTADSDVGTAVQATGGQDFDTTDYAGPQGTQVEVRKLFFNTPGRLKFLKSAKTEFSKICYVIQQAAAVHPNVHFRLTHQAQKVVDYPAANTIQDRLIQIYGAKFPECYLPIEHQAEGFHLMGFTVNPNHARTARTPQEIFVNRRPIKNATILHAVQEAYRSFLPKGRHPQFILFLTLDSQALDINVHPTKREVRFSNPEIIHSGVLRALKGLFVTTPSPSFTEGSGLTYDQQPVPQTTHPPSLSVQRVTTPSWEASQKKEKPASSLSLFVQEPSRDYPINKDQPEVHVLGQVDHTYLLGQINDRVYIVDQHTAHERVLFERLQRAWNSQEIPKQQLLIPEPIELPPHQNQALEEWLPLLAQCGLELERFGTQAFVVRTIPSALGSVSVSGLVTELLDELAEWRSSDSLDRLIHPIFATMACQSAVQAGRSMTQPEIKELLHDWAKERFPMTCPHGRRVAITHSLNELNTLFARPSK